MARVIVGPLPPWMPVRDLLGPGEWEPARPPEDAPAGNTHRWVRATLDPDTAADVAARIRGLGFAGHAVQVHVIPRLKRPRVRAGRTRDARARRHTSPGFARPGVRLSDEGRRYLTPEALALRIGEAARGRPVVDLTCGSGGNAIGFARAGSEVLAVDTHAGRLDEARHNARIYGVADRITFRLQSAADALQSTPLEALCFVDPPWGPWDKRRSTLEDLPLLQSLLPDLQGRSWWAKAPPSLDLATLDVPLDVTPVFGAARGDRHRVKFLWLQTPAG